MEKGRKMKVKSRGLRVAGESWLRLRRVAGCGMRLRSVASCELRVAGCELRVAGCGFAGLRVAGREEKVVKNLGFS